MAGEAAVAGRSGAVGLIWALELPDCLLALARCARVHIMPVSFCTLFTTKSSNMKVFFKVEHHGSKETA
jgi:hypothetical protein